MRYLIFLILLVACGKAIHLNGTCQMNGNGKGDPHIYPTSIPTFKPSPMPLETPSVITLIATPTPVPTSCYERP